MRNVLNAFPKSNHTPMNDASESRLLFYTRMSLFDIVMHVPGVMIAVANVSSDVDQSQRGRPLTCSRLAVFVADGASR